MASLRFAQTNLIQTATLKNGTGGAPADDEVSPWTMENAQTKARSVLWQQSSGVGTVNVDFLLASAVPVTLFGLHGHRGIPQTAAGIASCEVFTQTGAYAPAGTWTSRGTITMGAGVRDGSLIIASVTPASVRYALTVTTVFTLGRFFAGNFEVDFGKLYSPGRNRQRVDPDIRNEGVAQSPSVTITGDTFYLYRLSMDDDSETTRAALESVAALGRNGTFLMHDGALSKIHECVLDSGSAYQDVVVFDGIYTTSLAIRTLG